MLNSSGKDQADRGVLPHQPGPLQRLHQHDGQQPDRRRADDQQRRARLLDHEEAEHDAEQDRVADGVAHHRHAAQHQEDARQRAGDRDDDAISWISICGCHSLRQLAGPLGQLPDVLAGRSLAATLQLRSERRAPPACRSMRRRVAGARPDAARERGRSPAPRRCSAAGRTPRSAPEQPAVRRETERDEHDRADAEHDRRAGRQTRFAGADDRAGHAGQRAEQRRRAPPSRPSRSVHCRAAAAGATTIALISTTPTVCSPTTMATTSSVVSSTSSARIGKPRVAAKSRVEAEQLELLPEQRAATPSATAPSTAMCPHVALRAASRPGRRGTCRARPARRRAAAG